MKFSSKEDTVMIEIQNEEDLWYLSLVLKVGDRILAEVLRRTERKTDSIRNKKTEREKINVRLIVESIDFIELSERIHVIGIIESGPEDYIGEHQSINIERDSFLKVIPSNLSQFLSNLKESTRLSNVSVPVLSIDDENISFYELSETGNDMIWRMAKGSGKMYDTKQEQKGSEYIEKLEKYKQSPLFVIGPSIFRDSTSKLLSKEGFNVKNSQIGSSEEEGIRELLQNGEVNLRRSEENKLVSEFLKKINVATAAYGTKAVERVLDAKAVETLIISDRFFREKGSSEYMKKCDKGGCKVFVVHSAWETGKIIESFGGLGAILRYKIEE